MRCARLERFPSEQTQEVLRQTLVGSYERAAVELGAAASTTAFNRAGGRLLVTSENGRVRLLDRQGRVLWTRNAGGSPVGAFFAPDGKSVAAAAGRAVKIWSVDGGRLIEEARFADEVGSLGFVPTPRNSFGALLVGQRTGVKIVPPPDGKLASPLNVSEARMLATPGKPISLQVSSDGSLLAAIIVDAASEAHVDIFDLRTGTLLHTLPSLEPVAIAFSPDGSMLATGSRFHIAQLWDSRSGKLMYRLPHKGSVPALSFSSDGSKLATGSEDGAARVWDTGTGTRLLILAGSMGPIDSVAFSSSGRFVIAGSRDNTARVYKVDNGKELAVFRGHQDAVTSVAMSRDENLVVTGSDDGTARIWDPGVADQLRPVDRAEGPVRQVDFSPDGKTMLIVRDRGIRLRERSGALIGTLSSGKSTIAAAAFSPDSRLLAVESSDGLVRVLRGGSVVQQLRAKVGRGIAWAGDECLLTVGRQGVDAWTIPGGRYLRTLQVGRTGHRRRCQQ